MSLLELLFADDAAVCANSAEDLQIILQVFYDVFAEFGLEMALKKLKFLSRDQNPNKTWQFHPSQLMGHSYKLSIVSNTLAAL